MNRLRLYSYLVVASGLTCSVGSLLLPSEIFQTRFLAIVCVIYPIFALFAGAILLGQARAEEYRRGK